MSYCSDKIPIGRFLRKDEILMRKVCSRYSLFFLFIAIAISLMTSITHAEADLSQNYQAVPSSWARAEVDKAVAAGLIPEEIQGDYGSNITREEFSEIAVRLYEALSGKKTVTGGESPFVDTQNPKVLIANDLGIVKGIGDGKFAPYDAITRQEISVMLYRALKAAKPGYDFSASISHIFTDNAEISTWAREAVSYLYGIGVVNGVGENQFSPRSKTSREEAVVLANRMNEKAKAAGGNTIASRSGTSRRESVLKTKLEELIDQEMGKPYQWGAEGPDSYDCSGLVYSIYGRLGISLPRVARDQSKTGILVAKEDLEYGDLVFFARDGKNINHVGIYVGDGMFVHAPQTGDVVKATTLLSGYYERCYFTAKRVIR